MSKSVVSHEGAVHSITNLNKQIHQEHFFPLNEPYIICNIILKYLIYMSYTREISQG